MTEIEKTLSRTYECLSNPLAAIFFEFADKMFTTLYSMVIVQITFCPTSAKYFKEEVVFVCDNCHVKEFSLEGKNK